MSNPDFEHSATSLGSEAAHATRIAPRYESYPNYDLGYAPPPVATVVAPPPAMVPHPQVQSPLPPRSAMVPTRNDGRRGNPVRRSLQFAEPMTPQGLMFAFKRRWRPALLIGTPVALIAVVLAWFLLPAHFTAFALMRVAAVEPRLVFKTVEDQGDFHTYLKTQMALIKSRFVLNAALRRPGVGELSIVRSQKHPVEWLEKVLMIDTYNSPEILRLSIAGDQPQELATLVNAVKDAYLEEVVLAERKQRIARLADLERIYQDTEKKVRQREERISSLAKQLGSGDSKALTIKQQMALEYIAQLRREHSRLRFELMRAQVNGTVSAELGSLSVGKGSKSSSSEDSLLPDGEEVDPRVAAAQRRIAQLKGLIARYEQQVIDKNHPSLLAYRDELASLQQALVGKPANEKDGKDGDEVAMSRVEIIKKQEQLLREELEKYSQTVKDIGTSSYELEMMKDEVEQVAKISEKVGGEMEALRIELQSPTRVTLLQEAEVPQLRDMGRKKSLAGVAGMGGFGLVLLVMAVLEFHTRRITDPQDISQTLALDLLGTLPAMPKSGWKFWQRPTAGRLAVWNNALIESVDNVRSILLHGEDGVRRQVLLVASANSGEGKTTFACQLAGSLARAGRKTVLVDFDLRRPRVHELMQTPLELGLSEFLSDRLQIDTVIHRTSEAKLDVIPAGRVNDEALHSIARDGADSLFRQLRKDYEFVVVDSSPILYVADGGAIGRNVDGAILAIRSHISRMPVVAVTCERLEMLGIDLVGAVMVGVRSDVSGGYGYSYDYQYGKTERSQV